MTEAFLPSVNGVTNSVLRVLEHLQRTGNEAVVIAPSHPRGVPESYAGFPVVATPSVMLPWYPEMRLSATLTTQVEKLLAEFGPDVVHLAAPIVLGSKGILAAAKLGLPSVALFQTDVAHYAAQYGYGAAEPFVWHHLRKLHNMATINLAPSSYTRDQLIEQGFSRVGVWGRGVDVERFSPAKRDQALHDSWAPGGEVVIGYMGRLGSEKQVGDLAVLSDIPGTRTVIIGDGPARSEVEAQLPHAIFVGMQRGDELPRHLASADLFVHPGELETFGQAIQEAQACGLPTIAPRRGGPIDLITPSHNGWLYPPGDLSTMRRLVVDLVGDAYKRAAFGRTARLLVQDHTWPKVCDQLLGYYETAIELGASVGTRVAS